MTEIVFKKSNYDIDVEELQYAKYVKSEGLISSFLTLKFSGKDFNIKMANTLRRTAANRIPTYAFPPELINVEKNTCIAFNNDYMTLRLSLVPVLGMDPNLYYLHEKYWYNVDYADTAREKHENEIHNEFYVSKINESSNIENVTTNDMDTRINGQNQHEYCRQYPMLLVKLKPNDEFKCHMKSVLGIGDVHAMWKAARNGYYKEIDTQNGKEYHLTLEGNWQFSEYQLYIRSCKYIIHRLQEIKKYIETLVENKEIVERQIIHFTIPGEDHTMGEILNYEFQDHPDILGSGITKPDHLIKQILFKVQCVPKVKYPVPAMLECIDLCAKKFNHCGKLIETLESKHAGEKQQDQKPTKSLKSKKSKK